MKLKKSRLNGAALLLRAFVTLAVFGAIVWFLPMHDVWKAMTRIGLLNWMMVICVFGIGHVAAAYKWKQLVSAVAGRLTFRAAVSAHMAGLFANIWLPSIIGGDVVRAGWISGQQGIVVPAVIGLLDRAIDMLALAILIASGFMLVGDSSGTLAGSFLVSVGVLMVFGIFLGPIAFRWLKPEHFPRSVRAPGIKMIEIVKALNARPRPAIWSMIMAVSIQLMFVVLNYHLGIAIGIDVSFAVWLIAWPLAKIIALLPVSLGGLGVREVALAALLAPFAVSGTLAVAQALVWQSILLGFGLLAGAGLFLTGQRPPKRDKL